ncbi:phosphoribosylaminoimidazole-succinocarboxamide synthase [Bacillus glycinifermentans]|uniref:Phosphoribosylaminoimidazole-succinocarboxamide synthase n=1 Tax=Bacillus glycinifermentans TaxID=1664069 RepID=A0A0J6HWC1_9BACI|nr:phosphoribosylaminoimidazolesuccinocarboxamide synthase [Bacillus glycinifermentans]ATH94617.1 phosphoribosylaminoimidazolesuccinocarboxamide synthase [Bacillus glycinifermentans]KMM63277.1 phosphoribosylaminoimidazole-succinocarboxamide synthase [Bacillus glycinifermentans]KRT93643.1 phosphoribosylaminoimidazole-succinocarboxamide synthase [Bacillus glycinifermentans]MEC0486097.1 phosphoribosylaminoimidazolesuccinocarboxamide synthase [Bacillus glycinifermentans]MEC0494045.1 phosphoribosyl
MNIAKNELLYEGKAKKIFLTNDDDILFVEYKDSATAFNGEKKAEIDGKGRLNNEISSMIFTRLHEKGIGNHFVKRVSETEQLIKKVKIIPLEVVVRNVVAGSMSKRLGIPEGTELRQPLIEFYYKDDSLGDPLITEDHIWILQAAEPDQVETIKSITRQVNEELQQIFAAIGVRLIDFKLEFGLDANGRVLLADEISPDTCRLWDKETNEKLDKDVFRRNLGGLTDAYEEIFKRLGGM